MMVPNAISIFGNQQIIKFDQVLNHPLVDDAVKDNIKRDETYIGIKKLMKEGIMKAVNIRNAEVHSNNFNLDKIEASFNEILVNRLTARIKRDET